MRVMTQPSENCFSGNLKSIAVAAPSRRARKLQTPQTCHTPVASVPRAATYYLCILTPDVSNKDSTTCAQSTSKASATTSALRKRSCSIRCRNGGRKRQRRTTSNRSRARNATLFTTTTSFPAGTAARTSCLRKRQSKPAPHLIFLPSLLSPSSERQPFCSYVFSTSTSQES
jgi:hypothetical protein